MVLQLKFHLHAGGQGLLDVTLQPVPPDFVLVCFGATPQTRCPMGYLLLALFLRTTLDSHLGTTQGAGAQTWLGVTCKVNPILAQLSP